MDLINNFLQNTNDFWELWYNGEDVQKSWTFLGIKLYILNRWGKFLSFFAGAFIIIEIIGKEKILSKIETIWQNTNATIEKSKNSLKRPLTILIIYIPILVLIFIYAQKHNVWSILLVFLPSIFALFIIPELTDLKYTVRLIKWLKKNVENSNYEKMLNILALVILILSFVIDLVCS